MISFIILTPSYNKKLSKKMTNNGFEDLQFEKTDKIIIPGKSKLSYDEVKEREEKLKILSEKWKQERIQKEEYEKKTFGFSKNAEILNGRVAMFFFVTGLLTEYWTNQSLSEQIETMVRTLGIL